MTAFRTLRLRARYNILTPIAVLSAGLALTMGAPAMAANVPPVSLLPAATFSNSDTIDATGISAGVTGTTVTSLTNTAAGVIESNYPAIDISSDVGIFSNAGQISSSVNDAVHIGGGVTTFTNAGKIDAGNAVGVTIDGAVGSFANAATGHIGSTDNTAVFFDALVSNFTNDGEIRSGGVNDYGVEFAGGVTNFTNSATGLILDVGGGSDAVYIGGGDGVTPAVASFINAGNILSSDDAVEIEGNNGYAAGSITNSGTARSLFENGFDIYGSVDSFTNTASGVIHASGEVGKGSSGAGIYFIDSSHVTSFVNAGSIVSDNDSGVFFYYSGKGVSADSFTNSGTITGKYAGVYSEGAVGKFVNLKGGTITGGLLGVALLGESNVKPLSIITPTDQTFANDGVITGIGGPGVVIASDFFSNFNFDPESADTAFNSLSNLGSTSITSFTNTGTINGRYVGAYIDNLDPVTITNSGIIAAVDVTPFDNSVGVFFNGGTLNNSGTISGGRGLVIDQQTDETTITNSGTIIGTVGPGIDFSGLTPEITITSLAKIPNDPTIINSGLISGANGIAVDFGNTDPDTLILQTGGKFIGDVKFGGGTNTFDFSGYHGNMLFGVDANGGAITTLNAGSNLYVNDVANNQIAIVDDTAIRNAAQPVEDLVGGIQGSVADALNGSAVGAGGDQNFVAEYAATRPATPAARAAATMGIKPVVAGPTLWGEVFGGGDSNSSGAGSNTNFGGLVAGTQGEWVPGFTLGVLASYGRTNFNVTNGPQTVTGDTGVVGIYGKTSLDTIGLDFSLLGGFGSNSSKRQISTGTGTETATASFNSWFFAPEIGASMPVLRTGNGQFNLAGKLGYIGGNFAGYTETGSTANATVGSENIGIFDAKLELNGNTVVHSGGVGDVTVTGKLGLFAQTNAGGASAVPVSVLGLPTAGSSASGANGYGVYAGAGVDMPVSNGFTVGASVLGSARSDGDYAGIGKLRISGSY